MRIIFKRKVKKALKWTVSEVLELFSSRSIWIELIRAIEMGWERTLTFRKGFDGIHYCIEQTNEWNVPAVISGDGSISKCSLKIEFRSLHASNNMSGVPKSFYAIEPDTFRVCYQGVEVLKWPFVPVNNSAISKTGSILAPEVNIKALNSAQKKLKVVQELRRWCTRNKGFAIIFSVLLSRVESSELSAYVRPIKSINVYQVIPGRVVEGSIVNGVSFIWGRKAAVARNKSLFRITNKRVSATVLNAVGLILHHGSNMTIFKPKSMKDNNKYLTKF